MDDKFDDAITAVLESGQASASYLQRRLQVGYARAARLVDLMEAAGIVGPKRGAKPRDILVEQWPPDSSGFDTEPPDDETYE
jgi:S-DNA-T family DNA segregation ATPase FtsK/SpoIIIE